MAFARINGVVIDALQGTVSSERKSLNRTERNWSGRPRRDEASIVRAWEMTACLQTASEADGLEGLLEGRGHHFSFDSDAFSDDGLGPDTPASGNYTIETDGNQVFGLGYLDITTSVVWDTRIRGDWVVMYWRNVGLLSQQHIVVTSDSRKFVDGVRSDATATTELTVSDAVALTAGSYDDLVVLPYLLPDDFITEMYDWMSGENNPFSSLPQLVLDGDIVGGESIVVLGRVEEQSYTQGTRVDTQESNIRNVPMRLQEVQQFENLKFPEPWAAWLFNGDYENATSGEVMEAHSHYHAIEQGTWVKGKAGPFGFGESWDGNNDGYFDLPVAFGANLKGKTALTVLAWVKRDGLGTDQILLTVEVFVSGAEREKIRVKFDTSDQIAVECRPSSTDTGEETATGGTFTDTTEFHLVGAYVDIPGDEIGVYSDGAIVSQTAVSFASSEFSEEVGDQLRIGRDTATGRRLDADIAALYVFDRVVSEEDATLIYELGKKGVLL